MNFTSLQPQLSVAHRSAGGIGTIYGAILGAVVMQSLQTGMVLIGFDAAIQQMVVGSVW